MNMPRHMLRRLCALELVRVQLEILAESVPLWPSEAQRGKTALLCAQIEMHRERAFQLTVGGERLDLSGDGKASGRYARAILHMQRTVRGSWDRELDATAYLATVLERVAAAEEQLPRTPAYLAHRWEWGRLHRLLGKLYAALDPNYEDVANINYGAQVGERMVQA